MSGSRILTSLAAAVALCAAAPAMAAIPAPLITTTIDVSAVIEAGCLVTNSAGVESDLNGREDMVWGSLDFGSVPAAGNSGSAETSLLWNQSIRVSCTPGIGLSMSIDSGTNGNRLMKHEATGSTLQYYLYTDATMTADSEIPVDTPVDLAAFSIDYENVIFPIFARVILPDVSASGTYVDTVRVTLEW